MQKSILCLLLLAGLSAPAFSQKWSLALRAGGGASATSSIYNLRSGQKFDLSNMLESHVFGIGLRWALNPTIALEQEFLGASQGSTMYRLTKRRHYLKMPLSVCVSPSVRGEHVFFVRGGLYFAKKLHEEEQYRNYANSILDDAYYLEYNDARRFDFGYLAGMGCHFAIKNKLQMSGELRFEHGLRDLYGGGLDDRDKVTNIALLGIVGLSYAID